jgi:hypothetical protein
MKKEKGGPYQHATSCRHGVLHVGGTLGCGGALSMLAKVAWLAGPLLTRPPCMASHIVAQIGVLTIVETVVVHCKFFNFLSFQTISPKVL